MPAPLLDALAEIVGRNQVLSGDVAVGHCRDWTGRWSGAALAVVRPGSTAEVAAVVMACAASGVSVVPQGGNTGLVGGSVPDGEAVIVSTSRLDEIGPVDPTSGQLTAGAGATLSRIQHRAKIAGWRYPVDFAARDSATVGGMIATNAGGHHVLRHGMTRRQLVGIEAVLADGTVISHMGGLIKDNTGYDLIGLLCGSEGTLAIITGARVALVPPAPVTAVAMVGFDNLGALVGALGPIRRSLPEVEALELMLASGLAAVAEHLDAAVPVGESPVGLLIEVASSADPVESLARVVGVLPGVRETAFASSSQGAAELWRWREAHTEVINRIGTAPPHKLDVTVPLGSLSAFVDEVQATVAATDPTARTWIFGHAADGNLHVNITGPEPDDDRVDEAVLRLVASFEGSISAEHGIGRAKQKWLHLSRSDQEIAVFRSIKGALDPDGILNPGVLLPE